MTAEKILIKERGNQNVKTLSFFPGNLTMQLQLVQGNLTGMKMLKLNPTFPKNKSNL